MRSARSEGLSVRRGAILVLAAALFAVAGCNKMKGNTADGQTQQGAVRSVPDFGGVHRQYVEVEGVGPTRAAAVEDALRLAVKQVNGVSIDASEVQVDDATSISTSEGDIDISAASYAKAVETRSRGVVSDFKIIKEIKENEGFLGIGGQAHTRPTWRVRIGVNIAQYKASAEANRPRIIIATPRTSAQAYDFGDGTKSADEIRGSVRARLNNALTQTNRFTVLDRQFNDEMQSEFDLISSGKVNKEDTSRLGQMLAADLIVVPTIERMEYTRHARALRLADRELVSYSGGARISYQVVNATTGQLVMSDSFSTEFPTTRPTTLGAHIDADGSTAKALEQLTGQFVAKLLEKTFPISVISLNGTNVVLSQGGGAVKSGATYRAVLLGEALKDPQTGQDLGRSEQDFGSIQVTRSEPNVAYGVLSGPLPQGVVFKPGIIEIRDEVTVAPRPIAPAPSQPEAGTASGPGSKASPAGVRHAAHGPATKPKSAGPVEDPNW